MQIGIWAHFEVRELAGTFPNLFWGGVANFKGAAVNLAEMCQRVPPRALFHSLVVM